MTTLETPVTTPASDLVDLVILPCDSWFVHDRVGCEYPAEWVAECPACGYTDLACDRCHTADLMFNCGHGITRCSRCKEPIQPGYERIDLAS